MWHRSRYRTFATSRTRTSLAVILSSIVRIAIEARAADIAEVSASVVLALALAAYCVTRLSCVVVALTGLALLVRIVSV